MSRLFFWRNDTASATLNQSDPKLKEFLMSALAVNLQTPETTVLSSSELMFTGQSLFALTQQKFPEGLGGKSYLPVLLLNRIVELRIFRYTEFTDASLSSRIPVYEFSLFLPNRRYARTTLKLKESGECGLEELGYVPFSDRDFFDAAAKQDLPDMLKIALAAVKDGTPRDGSQP